MRSSRLAEQEYTISQNNARIDELTDEIQRNTTEITARRARYEELLQRKAELERILFPPNVPVTAPPTSTLAGSAAPLKSALKLSTGSVTQTPSQGGPRISAVATPIPKTDLASLHADLSTRVAQAQSSAKALETEISEIKLKCDQIKHRRYTTAKELQTGVTIMEADVSNLAHATIGDRAVPLQCLKVLQDIDVERERDALATRRELRELGMETSIKDRRVQELMLEAEGHIRTEESGKDKEIRGLHDEVFGERSALEAELEELRKSNQAQAEELRRRALPTPAQPVAPDGKPSPKKLKDAPILQERRKRREDIERLQKALEEERNQLKLVIANANTDKKKLDDSKKGHDSELKRMEQHIAITWKESGNAA